MRTTITKRYRFEAAHDLPFHQGKCQQLHGHSYVLEVSVEGPVKGADADAADGPSDAGMVMDFAELSLFVKSEIIAPLDHRYLNTLIPYPTAERIAHWIAERVQGWLPPGVRLRRLWLSETESGWVEVEP